MGPQPQPAVPGVLRRGGHQRQPDPAATVVRIDDDLRRRARDLVGGIEVTVTGQDWPSCWSGYPDQQVQVGSLAAIAQVQGHVLAQRPDAVLLGGGIGQRADRCHVPRTEGGMHFDRGSDRGLGHAVTVGEARRPGSGETR